MEKKKNNNIFLIVIFVIIIVLVPFLPKFYNLIEKFSLPKVANSSDPNKEYTKTVDEEQLESIHFPIMRNSIYDSNSYYLLSEFTLNNLSNNDILYDAYVAIEDKEYNIKDSSALGSCSSTPKEFDANLIRLRINNVLSKNLTYNLEDFYVSENEDEKYPGNWKYDASSNKFIYNGLCESKSTNVKYYDLKEFIKAEYDKRDIVVYYYIGFAKVEGNSYKIYNDAKMEKEITSSTLSSVDELNEVFKNLKKEDKKIYKFTFKNTMCSYSEYCLYKGEWVNDL